MPHKSVVYSLAILCIVVARNYIRTTPASLLPVSSLGHIRPINNSRMDAVVKEIRSSREFNDDYQLSRLIRRSFLIQKGGKLAFPLGLK